jgi:hypothetical protein
MANNTKIPQAPNLEPIWTQYQSLGGISKTTARNAQNSEVLTPSPVSPRTLPDPMYCSSYTASPTRQERVLINSLDGSTRKSNFGTSPALNPIEEEVPLVEHLERITILPPIHMGHGVDSFSPAPSSAPLPSLRHRCESIHRSNTTSTRHDRHEHFRDSKLYRRNSTAIYSRPHPTPPTPPPKTEPGIRRAQSAAAAEAEVEATRTQLRSWGPIYHDNAQTADAFVVARSLRRRPSSTTAGVVASSTGGTSSLPGRLTVRAIIRPRDPGRQPFLMQRNFDMDALRATMSEPDEPGTCRGRFDGHPACTRQVAHQSYGSPPPDSPDSAASPVVVGAGCHRSGSAGELCEPSRPPLGGRRSSLRSGELLSGRGAAASGDVTVDCESLVRDVRAVPVRKSILVSSIFRLILSAPHAFF